MKDYNISEAQRTTLIDIVLSWGCSFEEAEDIVQTAYLRAWRKREMDIENLLQICEKVFNKSRKIKKDIYISKWIYEDPLTLLIEDEEVRAIFQDIDELNPHYREVLRMFYKGHSINHISIMLGRNPNTVSRQKNRGNEKLKVIISFRKEAEHNGKRHKRKRK